DDGDDYARLQSLYRRSRAHFVAISERQRALMQELAEARVIHHGLDPKCHRFGAGDGGYCIFLGRFAREKGPHHAIDAAGAGCARSRASIVPRAGGARSSAGRRRAWCATTSPSTKPCKPGWVMSEQPRLSPEVVRPAGASLELPLSGETEPLVLARGNAFCVT